MVVGLPLLALILSFTVRYVMKQREDNTLQRFRLLQSHLCTVVVFTTFEMLSNSSTVMTIHSLPYMYISIVEPSCTHIPPWI